MRWVTEKARSLREAKSSAGDQGAQKKDRPAFSIKLPSFGSSRRQVGCHPQAQMGDGANEMIQVVRSQGSGRPSRTGTGLIQRTREGGRA